VQESAQPTLRTGSELVPARFFCEPLPPRALEKTRAGSQALENGTAGLPDQIFDEDEAAGYPCI
jgi:hypothetical protein